MWGTFPEDFRSGKNLKPRFRGWFMPKTALFGGFCIIMHKLWIIMHNYVNGKWKTKVSATILRKPHVDKGLSSQNNGPWIHNYSQLLVELYLENDRMPGSGGDHQISVTALRISMKLGNYLGINILRKVTEPFFRKNVLLLIKKFKRAFLGTLCFLNFKLR